MSGKGLSGAIIVSDNGLALGWAKATILIHAHLLSNGLMETNFNENLLEIHAFSREIIKQ